MGDIPVVSYNDLKYKDYVEIRRRPVPVTRPCRCEFVHSWLDAHLKYFPPLPEHQPKVITRMCSYTYGPPQMNYYYSQPVRSMYPPRDIRLPYITPPPHRISPLRPLYN